MLNWQRDNSHAYKHPSSSVTPLITADVGWSTQQFNQYPFTRNLKNTDETEILHSARSNNNNDNNAPFSIRDMAHVGGTFQTLRSDQTNRNNNGDLTLQNMDSSRPMSSTSARGVGTARGGNAIIMPSSRLGQIEESKDAMFQAAHEGNYKKLQEMLQLGAYVNALEPGV